MRSPFFSNLPERRQLSSRKRITHGLASLWHTHLPQFAEIRIDLLAPTPLVRYQFASRRQTVSQVLGLGAPPFAVAPSGRSFPPRTGRPHPVVGSDGHRSSLERLFKTNSHPAQAGSRATRVAERGAAIRGARVAQAIGPPCEINDRFGVDSPHLISLMSPRSHARWARRRLPTG